MGRPRSRFESPVYRIEDQLRIATVTLQTLDTDSHRTYPVLGDFASCNELAAKIIKFIETCNGTAKPFAGPTTPSSSRPHDPQTDLCGAALAV